MNIKALQEVFMNKIIQFGEGGFLRGFADWMIDICNEICDFGGEVTVIQPIPFGNAQLINEAGGRYTHIIEGAEGREVREISCISRCINPYEEFEEYLRLAEDPDYRFIISNTTEAGIAFNEADRLTDAPASSFPGKLTQLLLKRYEAGLKGFIFLPCELIEENGKNLKKILLQYAKLWQLPEGFSQWIEEENIFCDTLVDRINTGCPDPKEPLLNASEFFHLWVIEGYPQLFEEFPLNRCGLNIILTDDLKPYRTRKVRILNGAHTSITPYGLLMGLETVKDCIDDPKMNSFLKSCIFEEIIPTLDLPKEELESFANDVLIRFSNPYIKHQLKSISLNSVSKFKVRVLPSILEYIRRFNKMPKNLLFAFGMLIAFYRTEQPADDPKICTFMKEASVGEILANTALWGEDLSFLSKEVSQYADS